MQKYSIPNNFKLDYFFDWIEEFANLLENWRKICLKNSINMIFTFMKDSSQVCNSFLTWNPEKTHVFKCWFLPSFGALRLIHHVVKEWCCFLKKLKNHLICLCRLIHRNIESLHSIHEFMSEFFLWYGQISGNPATSSLYLAFSSLMVWRSFLSFIFLPLLHTFTLFLFHKWLIWFPFEGFSIFVIFGHHILYMFRNWFKFLYIYI